jgi:hypothetical protein
MHLIGISILIQIACAVHCVRNSRNSLWLMVIIFLSIPGCLAYAVFEIFPGLFQTREVRSAKAAAIRKLDPERQVRAARDGLEIADTAANRMALADALVENGSHREAGEHYRAALAKMPRGDRGVQLKLARAELEAGNAGEARKLLEQLPESGSASENDRAQLLLARALQDCGDTDKAMEIYADVSQRLPGGEAQCRRAALLMQNGRRGEAEDVLVEVEKLIKRLDRFEQRQNKEMYDWAARTLAEMRSG